jgi:hypothetical protein
MPSPTLMAPEVLWALLGPTPEEPYEPFESQKVVHSVIQFPRPRGLQENGRPYPKYISLNTGRQWGKTTNAVAIASEALLTIWNDGKPPVVRVTADTEEHARKIWDKFVELWTNRPALNKLIKSYSKEREKIILHNGAEIQMVSANNPQAMAGDTVTTWIIDEAQYFSQEAYVNMLPSTTVRGGYIVMYGVSQGDGPFREVCWRGLKENREEYPLYIRLRFTSYDNPHQDKAEIDAQRAEMTDEEFQQLFLAVWVEESSRAFKTEAILSVLDKTLVPRPTPEGYAILKPPIPGRAYKAGLDVAWSKDYTVHTIWALDGTLVAWQRFNRLTLQETMDRIAGLNKMYHNPPTATDTNGFGGAIYESQLRIAGINVIQKPVNSNSAKAGLVTALAVRLEQKRIRLPDVKFIREELTRYEKKTTKANGKTLIRYGAPSGRNDDFVISAGLAALLLPRTAPREDLTKREQQARTQRQQGLWENIA